MDKIYIISENYSLYSFQGTKFYLFDICNGNIMSLNEVSYTMLSLFDGKKNISEILKILISQYNIDDDTLEKDLNNLLNKCLIKLILTERR